MRGARWTMLFGALLLVGVSAPAQEKPDPDKIYADFNAFCVKHFGAEKEPLVYEKFGKDLQVLPAGAWQHVSENSATLAFETNLPAKSHVEYGETVGYGKKTGESDRCFYLHLHHLKELEVGKTYHYRLVTVDERGNRIATQDATFTTRKIPAAIRVPGNLVGPPYVLDKKGAAYILAKDLNVDGLAIEISASDITVDLNGHTITYNRKRVTYDRPKDYNEFKAKTTYGITNNWGTRNVKILNGTIVQGEGSNGAWGNGRGFGPIYLNGSSGEIAGVVAVYQGQQVSGIRLTNSGNFNVHHNVILGRGTKPGNRHMGSDAISGVGRSKVHHNLVKRVCHRGIGCGSGAEAAPTRVYNNEVYIDSWATNAYGINGYKIKYAHVTGNRIFTTGYHTSALPTISCSHLKVHGNLMHMVATKPNTRFKEYGPMSKHHGFRIKYNPKGGNLDFYDNLVIAAGTDGGCVKGATVKGGKDMTDVVFRGNVFKQTYEGYIDPKEKRSSIAAAAQWSCAVAYVGDSKGSIVFKGNTIISNYRNITFDDGYYASGSNGTFIDNKLVRIGDRKDYTTIRCGWWDKPHNGNMLIDTTLEGGADLGNVCFLGTGENDFSVAWTLTVKTTPGAEVVIKDRSEKEVFRDVAGDDGRAEAVLIQYQHAQKTPRLDTRGAKTFFTPHTVIVRKNGKAAQKTVTMDRQQQIEIRP